MSENFSFTNKWALLDTNVLSQMAREKRAEKFRPLFEFLKRENASIFLLDATYFELVGFTGNKEEYERLDAWIKRPKFIILPTTIKEVEQAILLSSCYKHADPQLNPKQISYCDCLHAAQLIKYGHKVFIVTTDIHDYPVSVFDIEKTLVIEDNKRAVIVGFITYNDTKWKRVLESFTRKKQSW